MKKTAAVIYFALSVAVLFARAPKKPHDAFAYRVFEEAVVAFDAGLYGNALQLANKAKDLRHAEAEYETYVLENALSPRAVKRVGTDFRDVLAVLGERDEYEAIAIINRYLRRFGQDYFSHSVDQMVSWIKEKAVYPEADFLIGRIYQLEGEFDIALDFYERARKESAYLDIPEELFDILYAMADLAKQQKKDEVYEQTLLLILDNDPNFKDEVLLTALVRTIDYDTEKHVERFFMLFRCEPHHSLRALYELGNIYERNGEAEQALKCAALGTVEAFTHILGSLDERDASFSYTDYGAFLRQTARYADVVEWGSRLHVWDLMFQFADRVAARGDTVFARTLYAIMAESMPDAYWREEAANRLRSSVVQPDTDGDFIGRAMPPAGID